MSARMRVFALHTEQTVLSHDNVSALFGDPQMLQLKAITKVSFPQMRVQYKSPRKNHA
jgi:hypothetical protein